MEVRKKIRLFRIAERTAEGLFINGFGQKAARLVLTSIDGRDLGGWAIVAVEERILAALREAVEGMETEESG